MIEEKQKSEYWWSKSKLADVIVFDLDGTLIDSDNANLWSYEAAIRKVMSRKVQINLVPGIRITRQILLELIPGIGIKQINEIVAQKEIIYPQYLSRTIVNPSLIDIIENSKNKKIILATNSRRSRAELLLNYHGLAGKFHKKFYMDLNDSIGKYARIIPEIKKEGDSILLFENDVGDIESAITCGLKLEQIINVHLF